MTQMDNKTFHKCLDSRRARFVFCDLHVHSPASYDVRTDYLSKISEDFRKKLESISLPKQGDISDIKRYQDDVLERIPPKEFLRKLVTYRDHLSTDLGLSEADDWSILAVTDHNVCKYSCELSELSWEKRKQNRLITLPAVELDVEFPVSEGVPAEIHLLCIFQPGIGPDDMAHSITTAGGGEQWKEGMSNYSVKDLPKFIANLRTSTNYECICIGAHVGSSKGVQKQCKETIRFSSDEAELSQLEAEIESALENDAQDESDVNRLRKRRDQIVEAIDEEAQIKTLEIIGRCGFDSLQVKGPEDHKHYRRLHRHDSEKGRSTLVVASDAHVPSDVFRVRDYVPHLKISQDLSKVSRSDLFSSIKHSLRLGDTRFISRPIKRSESWIEGIYLRKDSEDVRGFFRKPENGVIPLSRNLTCIVGGRGSGKSALLGGIGFVSKPDDFTRESKNRSEKKIEYMTRCDNLFRKTEIRVCWRFASGKLPTEHKKGVFSSRYFSGSTESEFPVLTNIEGKAAESVSLPNVHIYRFQELENHASGRHLREFLDNINRSDIENLKSEVDEVRERLRSNRIQILDLAKEIDELAQPRSPLKLYAENWRLFDELNSDGMQSELGRYDSASDAREIIEKAKKRLSLFSEKIEYTDLDESLKAIEWKSVCETKELEQFTDELEELKNLLNREEADSEIGKIDELLTKLRQRTRDVENRVGALFSSAEQTFVDVADELREKGLPTGVSERNIRRQKYDQSHTDLTEYKKLWSDVNELLDERMRLFEEFQTVCNKRTDVRKDICESVNRELLENLDQSMLRVYAEPGSVTDDEQFEEWLDDSLSSVFPRLRKPRVLRLIENGVTPKMLFSKLVLNKTPSTDDLIVAEEAASEGRIREEEVKSWLENRAAFVHIGPESSVNDLDPSQKKKIPKEIKEGLVVPSKGENDEDLSNLDSALKLHEIEFDDQPRVFMNDRPSDPQSTERAIDHMSPGQRCSALLPILLLNGDGPLIIDQPEDNLDNRLIREVVVNVLATMKLRRQIVIATHNPNLPVLGDAEQVIALGAVGADESQVLVDGDLDQRDVVKEITDIMEGGREAFQYRYAVYGAHWSGEIAEDE